jgi:hypothetical protein
MPSWLSAPPSREIGAEDSNQKRSSLAASDQAEVLATRRMIERSMERFGIYPARLMGDGSAEMLGWLVHEHGMKPHVTVFDKTAIVYNRIVILKTDGRVRTLQ